MKLNQLHNEIENYGQIYQTADFDHFFNIYKDKNGNYVYNLNSTLYIDVPESRYQTYVLTHDLHWPIISYKLYNTTHLVWFLLKINNVKYSDVFKIKHTSDKIKYLPLDDVQAILKKIY